MLYTKKGKIINVADECLLHAVFTIDKKFMNII